MLSTLESYLYWIIAMCAFGTSCIVSTICAIKDVYEVYPGSESGEGTIVLKTLDDKADQIAICKAAKEIEAQCHEIAEKRRKLNNIAASCK